MRPKGHIRDTSPPFDLTPHAHLVGDVVVPPTAMMPARIDDQQGSSCTGSYPMLVESWCAWRGIPCDPVSRRFGYTLGREIANPNAQLVDGGTNPAAVVEGMRRIGVSPEAAWPSGDLAKINERLDFFSEEVACTFQVTQIAVIEEDGDARCAAIRRAIAAGFPVGFAMDVDDAFEAWNSDAVYTGPTGPSLGNHALRIVGYRPCAFRVANSWGTSFGDGGFIWIADSFIGSDKCFDFYALNFAPAVHA